MAIDRFMKQQLPLNLLPQLVYGPDSLVVHDGIKEIVEHVQAAILSSQFALFLLLGSARSGKTHLGLRLHALATQGSAFPRIVEGSELAQWLADQNYRRLQKPDEPLVIDDADHYLRTLQPGESGPFVAMVEYVRTLGGTVVLLCSQDPESFALDQHILSRLRAGCKYQLGEPSEDQLKQVLHSMAQQRGFKFDERKLEFLYRRLPRSIRDLEVYLENLNSLAFNTAEKIQFSVLGDAL